MYRKLARQLHVNTIWGLKIQPFVFLSAATIILSAVLLTIIFTEQAEAVFSAANSWVSDSFGWFFILTVTALLGYSIYLMFSKFGSIRLGGPNAEPEFGLLGWFAMLFSAGMGIGLLFWSVAEPIYHYSGPPVGEGETAAAARQAMVITYFHWGLHAWGIYAVVALALAFFSFNGGLPLTIRSAFYPLFGRAVNGLVGNLIDTVAVVATLFGVATSLGFGVMQVSAGLNHVAGVPNTALVQVLLIAGITALATWSVVSGLDKGIRRLSEINMLLALLLLIFVVCVGPTLFVLKTTVQNVGDYVQALPRMSFWTIGYDPENTWQSSWTVFYWAWWISWSPFVGMFIARISRGRTIKEFLMGVLFVPTILTFAWLSFFGNTALYEELFVPEAGIVTAVNEDVAVALFVLLEKFPLALITSSLAIGVVVTFFVTSSDSGSLVIDIITAGGHLNPPVAQRLFWAILEGVTAAALLTGGGLLALQTMAILSGLPFALVLILMSVSLHMGLSRYLLTASKAEGGHREEKPGGMAPAAGAHRDVQARPGPTRAARA